MKVDWSEVPEWLTTVTQQVREKDGKFYSHCPSAWSGGTIVNPAIWVNGLGVSEWGDPSEHLLFAELPDYIVEYEHGDTTENSIQFRPDVQPAKQENLFERYKMTQDEIIEMARQAGFEEISVHEWAGYTNSLEAFAQLVFMKGGEA
jgi:hypothetical protein